MIENTEKKLSNSVSVVVPVYNSELSLSPLVKELAEILPRITDQFELILINDGSRDRSWEIISGLLSEYPWVKGVNLMRNYGQHNALICGIRQASNSIVVTMDDDLQHPPCEILKLLEELLKGYDVVYGAPEKETHGFFRNCASQITKMVLKNAMGADVARHVGAFRCFRTILRDSFADFKAPFASLDVLLTWGTTKFSVVYVKHEPRKLGKSNYTFRKLLTHAMNMVTGFSIVPLQFASFLGFFFTFFGLLLFLYVIIRYIINGGQVPGFAFIASTVSVFSGVQLFVIGIIGEYIARMHERIMNKPLYMIRNSRDMFRISEK